MTCNAMRAKKLVIYCKSAEEWGWNVRLGVENPKTKKVDYKPGEVRLEDPWKSTDYEDRMIPDSSSTSQMGQGDSDVPEGLRAYGSKLFDQLSLQAVLQGSTCNRISVHEDMDISAPFTSVERRRRKSIHSLLWEVFEHPKIWPPLQSPKESKNSPPRITRVITGQTPSGSPVRNDSCRVLLVVARSFQYLVRDQFDKRPADCPPSLIQNTLLEIGEYLEAKGIASRFSLDVVRPGTFQQLRNFLEAETGAGRKYDIVHFDVHGAISNGTSKLRFGNSKYDLRLLPVGDNVSFVIPDAKGYDEVDISVVAKFLQDHKVTRVALNACLSSNAQHEALPSMAETLIEKGVSSVSAMSYEMLDQTAKTYYDSFYQALILGGKGFHEAAARGRESLRLRSQDSKEWLNPTNYRNRVRTFSNRFQPRRPHLKRWISLIVVMLYLGVCPWPDIAYSFTTPLSVNFFLQLWMPSPSEVPRVFRLKAAAFWVTIVTLIMYLALHHQSAPSRALEILRYFSDQLGRVSSQADHCTRYSAYLEEQRKHKLGKPAFELSIEHMTIEDKLYSKKRVYLFGDRDARLNSTIENLTNIWIRTGFIDSANIKDANDFFKFLSRPFSTKRYFNGSLFKDRDSTKRGPRHLVVIENIHEFVERLDTRKSERLEDRNAEQPGIASANQRIRDCGKNNSTANLAEAEETQKMNAWIKRHSKGDCYLIITGGKHGEWWQRQNWGNEIKMSWGSATPHDPRLITWHRQKVQVVQMVSNPYV